MDSLSLIETRLAKLENLVGTFENIEDTKGLETINNISSKLTTYISNSPKIILSMKNSIRKT
jgi:hypothetical protein